MDFRKLLIYFIYTFFVIVSITGCSNKIYFNVDIVENIKSKQEYKIILIENKDTEVYKDIYRIFKSYSWNIIKTNEDINDIEYNKQYQGLPKYVFILEKENIYYNKDDKGYFYYHIYIQDIKDDKIVFEVHDYGNNRDIKNHITFYLRKVF